MRWLYATSKTFTAVQAKFWPSICSFSGFSEAHDVPPSSLEAYPCCSKQKDPNNATFSQSGAKCQWLFFPILYISPPLPSFLAFIFISRLVLYPVPSRPKQKKLGFFPPFVMKCVPGITMGTHIRGHVNPVFRLCGFGVLLCWA